VKIALVGLPLTGKTTIFSLLTGAGPGSGAGAGAGGGGTRGGFGGQSEARVGVAKVPDPRLDFLSGLYHPAKTTPAKIDFVDFPPFAGPGASSAAARSGGRTGGGANSGASWLATLRTVDAIVMVARAFRSPNVPPPADTIDPLRDLNAVASEMILADMVVAETRLEKAPLARQRGQMSEQEFSGLSKAKAALEAERLVASAGLTAEETHALRGYAFLTAKPWLVAVNLDEDQLLAGTYDGKDGVTAFAAEKGLPVVEFCGKIEAEMTELPPEERAAFMADYGLAQSGIDRLAQAVYRHLNLISFLTAGEDECRAWTIERGTDAKHAAGKIHSDIEKGFIKAETVSFEVLKELGSMAAVKAGGLLRLEGKDYIVQDGDIINFRFNV